MSENSTAATDLTSQYTAQVAGDLERNVGEQERVTAEIAALQEQLTVLQHDHTILVNMQQALGLAPAPAVPAAASGPEDTPEAGAATGGTTVPAPRRRAGAKTAADKPKRAKKASARTASGKSARKSPVSRARTPRKEEAGTERPKLVDLVRRHLSEQSEPRSAAEVAGALGESQPGRTVRTTVVRSTLEGLVARNQAQRSKQGSSVFYTASDTAGQAAEGSGDARS
ncbi:hypothetical protein [Streptomyces sp. NA02536]|uniref:hypothetical protein n=1 Tax=Streptomyces sp. NA02536 TaxID=2742133 RepID=UPI00159291AA|nr:hypothetical protein [Streptomyces sp. NA02536]QKV98604.1 hypothetical protein HUT14_01510 [Streptomyces sp. NA02536]